MRLAYRQRQHLPAEVVAQHGSEGGITQQLDPDVFQVMKPRLR